MSYDHQNGRLIIRNQAGDVTFDSHNGMMLCFDVVSGAYILPAQSTGQANRVFDHTATIATGLDNRATFAMGHAKFDAGIYFTGAWCAVGGSSVILNRKNAAHTRYSVWTEISGNTLYMKAKMYVSQFSTVGSATVTYRLAIMGFASATT